MTSNTFRSERLIYRAVEPEDIDFFLSIQNDVSGYHNSNFSLAVPQSKKKAAEYQKHVIENTLLGVVVCLPKPQEDGKNGEDMTAIGCVHLTPIKDLQFHHRSTALSIDVIPEYQGKGYGSEAIQWAVKWAFENAGLHKVKIGVFGYNPRAKQLYERLGFKVEGTLREEIWFQGKWYDSYWLGMLDWEWREAHSKSSQANHAALVDERDPLVAQVKNL